MRGGTQGARLYRCGTIAQATISGFWRRSGALGNCRISAVQDARRAPVLIIDAACSRVPASKRGPFAAARKNPLAGSLDRMQVVKGWMDKTGKLHERTYDVAVADGRKIGKDGRCKVPVGNTVDVANSTWTNSIGEPEMIGVWRDPDFDAELPAVYYARVIEIPTPRWTACEAKRYGVKMSDDVPMTTTERAYTSPIWYKPG
jgi:hypothetical protein